MDESILSTLSKTTLAQDQSNIGMLHNVKFRNEEFRKRNIITKDVLHPVLDAKGNKVLDKNGKPVMRLVTVPVSIPDIEREALKIFVDSQPCWFEGCEEIRKAFKEELNQGNYTGCAPCKKGAVWRKYLKKTVDALNLAKRNKG